MKTFLKIISVTLVVILSVFPSFEMQSHSSSGTATEEQSSLTTTDVYENKFNKLHFYLDVDAYETIDNSGELEAAIEHISSRTSNDDLLTTNTESSSETLFATVQFSSDFQNTDFFLEMSDKRKQISSTEELRSFRKQLNDYSKAYHKNLVSKSLLSVSELTYTNIKQIEYSPFVVLEIPTENVTYASLEKTISKNNIVNVSIRTNQPENNCTVQENDTTTSSTPTIPSWDDMLRAMNAYDIVHNQVYTGEGIRIGVLEGAVCNPNNPALREIDITVRESTGASDAISTSFHATTVTATIAALAPDASYFSSNDFEIGIAWFIDQYCDIVNMSILYTTYTEYSDIDEIFDYQISQHFINVIVCAGNYSSSNGREYQVTSPGLAYNVITVGGVDYTDSGWVHSSEASYTNPILPCVKPNISAPYWVNIPNVGPISGTSYSTPVVSGFVALLCESDLSYCMAPEKVLSALTSTAQKTQDYSATVGSFDDRVGAGVLDLGKMIGNTECVNIDNANKQPYQTVIQQNVNLTQGTELQAALSWIAWLDIEESNLSLNYTNYITDYDLQLLDSDGNIVESSDLAYSNVEMICYTVPENGIYTIAVFQYGEQNSDVFLDILALTYHS